MAYILGLTGGIASGKSTVSALFKERGIPVVDADYGARVVVEPGKPAFDTIVETFGEEVLLEDGSLNRQVLGQMIFKDKEKREMLNQCVKGYIREWILTERERLVKEGHELIVLDIPLLLEAGYESEVDAVMVVQVNEQTQRDRLMTRNQLTEEEANERIQSQMPLEEKIAQADYVIDNNGTPKETEEQVEEWLEEMGYHSV